ncbi:tRNA uridine-5-carboxymethylaminomethyl(34) synthesis enzyme MnmG [Helicobacter cappadocius]|uniref:tRNA uridine 5-carboxymethylaminomethyl modification enzyme MnmG n=1 Tax=Helicobacter cappadocius TaxID=3063998 RepID=A0AA90T4R7_9HELI|nr:MULTISPECIES: tRNA uridine-5-carboxymethylaminomethyl(34) synthesis enzyme MnmG [unclassified Helicobacter]MDO7252775.1 tRNA uridine-5-carboxymethylaminomethyl(34) synthesis enzyme MnmG [Helicobacter sp. faydin-H75]MDP2538643.1 tRNA uridine-5-carboxymethylaminomethyl(34) synthesis enzyme MnmG [Helicobacter sp. faydin-H76]
MKYDVIVIGGGHAGIEASLVSAKMGAKTHLLTILVENIGLASCNPAVGGLGKGHLTKEVDALGGAIGIITDNCGIQYRTLNASKGPAVRGTRAQIDMDKYRIFARNLVLNTPNLSVSQEIAEELIVQNNSVVGVKTSIGKIYYANKIIITTGTFLRGLVHIGESKSQNGRFGENASIGLSKSLESLGFEMGRLKTGTCARIDGKTIDFSKLEIHNGDFPAPSFSYKTDVKNFNPIQLPCYVTYTNEKTHQLIRDNFHRAPLFTGQIEGVGPRYCPSIEDKVNRFADRERHQLFLEPQTIEATEYYVNGLSTSLPFDIQEKIIASIEGLENARITRYGYAIEYDYVQPTELFHTLETKKIKNLYLAGQINGTTGYEEAAAQGIMAGINAVLSLKKESDRFSNCFGDMQEFILRRDEAYIGVMIDDLVTKGTKEPYRVFTSRAEYRLLLREDNAIFRLIPYAHVLGTIEQKDYEKFSKDIKNISEAMEFLENATLTPSKENLALLDSLNEIPINDKCSPMLVIGRDSFDNAKLKKFNPIFQDFSELALDQIRIQCKYHSYIQKQYESISKMNEMLEVQIPEGFVFDGIPGLSLEVVEKLNKFRPKSLFNASQISGITPASLDVLHLYIHLRKSC